MKRDQTAKCFTLIQTVENDPKSFDFRQPVDYIGLDLNDYLTIVKKPMDLSTVKVLFQIDLRKILNQINILRLTNL